VKPPIQSLVSHRQRIFQRFYMAGDMCVRDATANVGLNPLGPVMPLLNRPKSRHQHMQRNECAAMLAANNRGRLRPSVLNMALAAVAVPREPVST
jgi:hypothetical protein